MGTKLRRFNNSNLREKEAIKLLIVYLILYEYLNKGVEEIKQIGDKDVPSNNLKGR